MPLWLLCSARSTEYLDSRVGSSTTQYIGQCMIFLYLYHRLAVFFPCRLVYSIFPQLLYPWLETPKRLKDKPHCINPFLYIDVMFSFVCFFLFFFSFFFLKHIFQEYHDICQTFFTQILRPKHDADLSCLKCYQKTITVTNSWENSWTQLPTHPNPPGGGGLLWYFDTCVGSAHFLGLKILNFDIFWGNQKN